VIPPLLFHKKNSRFFFPILIFFIISCTLYTTANAKNFHKWIDEEGNVHYSSIVPPSAVGQARSQINNRGFTVSKVAKAKSEEEIEAAHALTLREKNAKTARNNQNRLDQQLLRTFSSAKDLLARESIQLESSATRIHNIKANIGRTKKIILTHQKKAAQFEKQGKGIPEYLTEELAELESVISTANNKIKEQQRNAIKVKKKYRKDLVRYQQLAARKALFSIKRDVKHGADLYIHAYHCRNIDHCNIAWQLAKDFISKISRQHTKNDALLDSEILIRTPAAENDDQFSVVSAIEFAKKPGADIFIHTECMDNKQGKKLCATDKLQKIRTSFSKYIKRNCEEPACE
jgi:hypothetical protein